MVLTSMSIGGPSEVDRSVLAWNFGSLSLAVTAHR